MTKNHADLRVLARTNGTNKRTQINLMPSYAPVRNYQLDFVRPGISPLCANLRKHILQRPKSL
jgi:hypothetical protein